MKYAFFLILCWLIINLGCDFRKEKKIIGAKSDWSTLTVVSEETTVITINNYEDTSIIKFYDRGGFFTGWHKLKIDSMKARFTTAEKDSLFRLAKDIILNPPKPKRFCTEFIGDLKLVIEYKSFKQSIEYTSVCDWDSLSNQTVLLSKILNRRIKWKN